MNVDIAECDMAKDYTMLFFVYSFWEVDIPNVGTEPQVNLASPN
jgi:hypothetical protein